MTTEQTEEVHLNNDNDNDNDEKETRSQYQYRWYNINPKAFPAKCSYFFEKARVVGFSPNLVMFLTSIGLNKAEAGFIGGLKMVGMLSGGIFWGYIADKWHCHRTIVLCACVMSLLSILTQPLIGLHYGNAETNKCPTSVSMGNTNASVSILKDCIGDENCTFANMTERPILPRFANNATKKLPDTKLDTRFNSFFVAMLLINIAIAFAEANSTSFIDTGTLRQSQLSKDRPIVFGRQRMFGSFGSGFGILASNIAVDYFPESNITCYTGIFVVYALFSCLCCFFTLLLYRGLSFRKEANGEDSVDAEDAPLQETVGKKPEDGETKGFNKLLLKTILRHDVLFFYATTLISGLQYSQVLSFLFPYLKEMDGSSIHMTLSIVLPAISASVGFAFCKEIINILGGTWNSILFSFAMYFLRYFTMGFMENAWLVVAVQVLHCFSTTLFQAAGLNHLKETSPLPIMTTMISLFNTLLFGVGTIIGSSLSGVVYELYGGRVMYKGTGLLALAWFCVSVIYVALIRKQKKPMAEDEHHEM
ncbi:major facilitator superfamily domain-containing protein 6-A-like [Clytia hemisphaerica]|uniref:major facilitator superfamily domain-containing protein 6-A-like n=1 Tax=Clytia hemisphaerica TaxID=252671 RepID=UPI0034D4C77E